MYSPILPASNFIVTVFTACWWHYDTRENLHFHCHNSQCCVHSPFICISIHKMSIINKLYAGNEAVERVKKKPSEMGLNWMNKAGLRFLPGISCQHNKQASEWASESEINEYYDGNHNNTTASQWKITVITTINEWLDASWCTHIYTARHLIEWQYVNLSKISSHLWVENYFIIVVAAARWIGCVPEFVI